MHRIAPIMGSRGAGDGREGERIASESALISRRAEILSEFADIYGH